MRITLTNDDGSFLTSAGIDPAFVERVRDRMTEEDKPKPTTKAVSLRIISSLLDANMAFCGYE